jgi:hypothetical protein
LFKSVVDQEEELDKVRDRLFKSAVMGLSMATFVLGLGLFVPARLIAQWFNN